MAALAALFAAANLFAAVELVSPSEGIAKYGDANSTWRERIELYLLDCGVTKEEIDRFRSIMLE